MQVLERALVEAPRPKVVPLCRVVDRVLLELHEQHLKVRDPRHVADVKPLLYKDSVGRGPLCVVEEPQVRWKVLDDWL